MMFIMGVRGLGEGSDINARKGSGVVGATVGALISYFGTVVECTPNPILIF